MRRPQRIFTRMSKMEFLILRIFSVWNRYLGGSPCWHQQHHHLCKCLSRKSGFHKEASSWPNSFSALQMELRIVLRNLKYKFLGTSRSTQQVKNVRLTVATEIVKVRLSQHFLASFAWWRPPAAQTAKIKWWNNYETIRPFLAWCSPANRNLRKSLEFRFYQLSLNWMI